MSRIKRTSPALVISILALIAALVVPALAQVATTALTKKEKRVVRKIATFQANKRITARAPGLSVGQANSANTANSANSADQANNATTANGVRPVKVSFAAASGGGPTVFLNQAGLTLQGQCFNNNATVAVNTLSLPNGTLHFTQVDEVGGVQSIAFPDTSSFFGIGFFTDASAPFRHLKLTLHYRAANGTTVTGDLQLARGAGAAQCVISGMLFVG
jgi:hypothetical protein